MVEKLGNVEVKVELVRKLADVEELVNVEVIVEVIGIVAVVELVK